MNFIQQAFTGKNDWWRYLLSILLIFLGWQLVGIIPLAVVAILHSSDIHTFQQAAADNFMNLGINANLYLFSMIMMFAIGLLFVYWVITKIHKRSFTSALTSRKKLDWKRIFFAFGIWLLASLLLFGIDYFMAPENFEWNFKFVPFILLVLISLFFLPLQTSFEEVLFRGYLMQSLGYSVTKNKSVLRYLLLLIGLFCIILYDYFDQSELIIYILIYAFYILIIEYLLTLNSTIRIYTSLAFNQIKNFFARKWFPLAFTAISFGLLHSFNPEVEKLGYLVMLYYIGTGLLFGMTTLLDEGMELALGMHAANNIVAAIFVTTNWTVFQTDALFIDTSEPSLGMEMYVPILIIYPLILLLFSKKYAWKNWKEKLVGRIENPLIQSEDKFQ